MSLIKFYKPNSKNTGHACSFDLQSTGDSAGVYLEIVKQTSWNDSEKIGSFKDGKKTKIKLNSTEAASFVDTVASNRETKLFHSTATAKTSINFTPYKNKEGVQIGFSLSLSQGQDKYLVGFTFAEAICISEFMKFALSKFIQAAYAEKKERIKKANQPA